MAGSEGAVTAELDVIVDRPATGVVEVRLNRPDRRNAVTTPLLRQLRDALVEIGDDRTAKVVVLSGAGPAFCAGADFDEFTNAEPPNPADSLGRLRLVIACIRGLLELEPVTIAAVHGPAIGAGWGLALGCDTCWAGDQAVFALPEVAKGFRVPRLIATRLAHVVGPVRAAEIVLSGRKLDADEATSIGAVGRRITGSAPARDAAVEFAIELAAHPRTVLRGAVDPFRTLAVPDAVPGIEYQWPER